MEGLPIGKLKIMNRLQFTAKLKGKQSDLSIGGEHQVSALLFVYIYYLLCVCRQAAFEKSRQSLVLPKPQRPVAWSSA
jgi:hypothetical protein